MRFHSSFILHPSSLCRRGFTLTEVLIVIGIIILVIALAVPALSIISGSRSVDGAENNVSAMLGKARADAIGLQRVMGVFFFIDPATERVTLAEVFATDRPAGAPANIDVYLDLVPDVDFLALPKGVTAQVIDNSDAPGGVRADDGYIGFNKIPESSPPAATNTQYGGVILFDGFGKLVNRSYAFRSQQTDSSGTFPSIIFNLLYAGKVVRLATDPTPPPENFIPANNQPAATDPMRSAFGLVLMDREAFENNGTPTDPQANPAAVAYGTESGEEQWIDANSIPLLINRFNGTLVRGE